MPPISLLSMPLPEKASNEWVQSYVAWLGFGYGMAEYVVEATGFRREMVAGGGKMKECGMGRVVVVGGGGGGRIRTLPMWHVCCIIYCEKYKKGFIQRLNEATRDTWHDRVVDEVLGMPVMELCGRLYGNNNASWVGSISM
ncbi:hypothetical protein GmHk_08G023876 [Glycine max]|nr:hypothetical protein GmHk_08G023876 [Glycine max]